MYFDLFAIFMGIITVGGANIAGIPSDIKENEINKQSLILETSSSYKIFT